MAADSWKQWNFEENETIFLKYWKKKKSQSAFHTPRKTFKNNGQIKTLSACKSWQSSYQHTWTTRMVKEASWKKENIKWKYELYQKMKSTGNDKYVGDYKRSLKIFLKYL